MFLCAGFLNQLNNIILQTSTRYRTDRIQGIMQKCLSLVKTCFVLETNTLVWESNAIVLETSVLKTCIWTSATHTASYQQLPNRTESRWSLLTLTATYIWKWVISPCRYSQLHIYIFARQHSPSDNKVTLSSKRPGKHTKRRVSGEYCIIKVGGVFTCNRP